MSPSPDQIVFEPCRPTQGEALLVMTWRNDPSTLANSFHRAPKSWDNFWPEFRDTYCMGTPGCQSTPGPVFALIDGARVGFLRFRPAQPPHGESARCVDISINLAPEARGRGLGTAILKAATGYLGAAGIKTVLAEVRLENAASLRAFEAAGYRSLGPAETKIADTGECAKIISFILELG